jgi:hypothetical protein
MENLTPITIKDTAGFVTNIDQPDSPEHILVECRGGVSRMDGIIFQRDFGTLHRFATIPIRPNAFKVISGAVINPTAGIIIRLTVTGHGYGSSGNITVYVDEVGGAVEANGRWTGTIIDANTIDLVGSTFVNNYTSGGIITMVPIVIDKVHTFVDTDATEYEIVVGRDSSDNMRVYVYDAGWIELTRNYLAAINGAPASGATTITINSITENGVTKALANDEVKNWVVVNTTATARLNQTVFITTNSPTVLTVDTVIGSNGLGWLTTDTLAIYRFPCVKFNYTFANGVTPHIRFLAEEAQRKVAMMYQATDGTKHQAIQIMKRAARNYFYDASGTAYLRTLPPGWYMESDFGIINPYFINAGLANSPISSEGTRAITGTTGNGVSPIVVTSNGHGLYDGYIVTITGVAGNTAANGTFSVTRINANTFSLDNSSGNGAWSSGGIITFYTKYASLYDQSAALQRQWARLFGLTSNAVANTGYPVAQIIFNTPTNGDILYFVAPISYYGGSGQIGIYTKGAAFDAGTKTFTSADELVTLMTTDFGTKFTIINVSGTITVTGKATGSSGNSCTFTINNGATGSPLGISNVSQGVTTASGTGRNFEGGLDITATTYIQSRCYLTAMYGYQESDVIFQGFFATGVALQSPSTLLFPRINFALLNKELTDLNLYIAFATSTIVTAGWADAASDYYLAFRIPIQEITTDLDYVATEWTQATLKNQAEPYLFDITQANMMLCNSANYELAKSTAQTTLNDALNHAPDKHRTYPTPRFGVAIARTQGATHIIDADDSIARLSLYDGVVNQDDNFPDVSVQNDSAKLRISWSGVGKILGMAVMNGNIYIFRSTEMEFYDTQSGFQGSRPCDFSAVESLVVSKHGISWCGGKGIYILPSNGSEYRTLNPQIQNLYDGTLLATSTAPYMTSAYRAAIVSGYDEIYDGLWFVSQVNKTTSGSEYVAFVHSFQEKALSQKPVGWYQRKLNIGTDGSVKCFSSRRSDKTLTIVYGSGILQYPNRAGSYLYQDDVAIDGGVVAKQISQSKGIPTKVKINLGSLYSISDKTVVDNFKIDFIGASGAGTGTFNINLFANKKAAAYETKTQPIDSYPVVRNIPPFGGLERFAVQIDLTEGAESDIKRFDISTIELGVKKLPVIGNK